MASSPQYTRNSRPNRPTHTPSTSLSFSPLAQLQQVHNQGASGGGGEATAPQVQPPNARMSPSSRYHSNLKVLRRRDPSIISIFDQFSHVCVYHHNGQKWEKHGFEGSMFLFERDSYPSYGFYVLNRVGSDDYIQRLYPEDDITAHGGYLMLRSYPQSSTARIDAVANVSGEEHHKFSGVYAYAGDAAAAASKDKGESQTIGLWTFTTDGREPLMDVMLRLHSYIKKKLPYPEEYRYGPDRPPPPNPHLGAAAAAGADNDNVHVNDNANNAFNSNHVITNNNNSPGGSYDSDYSYNNSTLQQYDSQRSTGSGAPSAAGNPELDKLFAKFLPATTNTVNTTAPVTGSEHGHIAAIHAAPSFGFGPGASGFGGSTLPPSVGSGAGAGVPSGASNNPQSAASMSVQSLLASFGGTQHHQQQQSRISAQVQPYLGGSTYGVGSMVVPPPPSHLPFSVQQQQQQVPTVVPPPPPTTGLSLLDTIFASASSAPTPPAVPVSVLVPQAFAGVGGQYQQHQQQQLPISVTPAAAFLHSLPSTVTAVQPYPPPHIQPYPSLPPSFQPYSHLQPHPQQQQIPIHSPIPKSRALPTPQVLSQTVIGSLLGYSGNSPGAGVSVGGGGSNGGRKKQSGGPGAAAELELESPTHPSSRDGDNELEELDDGSGSGGGASSEDGGAGRGRLTQSSLAESLRGTISSVASTTVAQGQGQGREKKEKKGKAGKNVMMSGNVGELGAGVGLSVVSVVANNAVGGDVTPRPGFLGDHLKSLTTPFGAATTTTATGSASTSSATPSTATIATVPACAPTPLSTSPTQKQKQKQKNKPCYGRPLVPFEPDSELWPYSPPRLSQQGKDTATVSADGDDSNNILSENGNGNDDGSSTGLNGAAGGDIVELDWEDISALSDLKEFERVQKEQQQQRKKKHMKEKGNVNTNAAAASTAATGGVPVQGAAPTPLVGGRKKKEKKKKGGENKQERLEAAAKAREEIEKSWDFPDVTNPVNWGLGPTSASVLGARTGSVTGNGVTNGRTHTNGTGTEPGMMNLNGKTVPIPKIFNDDSPPASPSPIPSPVVPLSPVRPRSSAPQKYDEFEFVYEYQPPPPRTPSPSPLSKNQGEKEENVEVEISSNVNGSAKKKRNRRKFGTKVKEGAISPPPAPPLDATAIASTAAAAGRDDSVSSGGACELSTVGADEERVMKSLLSAIRGDSIASSEQGPGSRSASGKAAFMQEVRRLMESEAFANKLWMGYLGSGEGAATS